VTFIKLPFSKEEKSLIYLKDKLSLEDVNN